MTAASRGVLSRRRALAMSGWLGLGVLWPRGAAASARAPMRLRELLSDSNCCILGIPLAAESEWETSHGRTRIVTYSKVGVDEAFDARTRPGDELLVRTLGGEVGGVGQWVPQEAGIALHEPAVLFLTALPAPGARPGAYAVTGMAEGHYRLRHDAGGRARLRCGAGSADDAGARGELDGLTLSELRARIARERRDAR